MAKKKKPDVVRHFKENSIKYLMHDMDSVRETERV